MGNGDNEFLLPPRLRLAAPEDVPGPEAVAERVQERADSLLALIARLRSQDPARARDLAGRLARDLLAAARADTTAPPAG